MINTNKKQLLIFLAIILFMFLIIGIYFFKIYNYKSNYETIDSENILENDLNILEENINVLNNNLANNKQTDDNIIVIHITGAISNPGIVKLPVGARIADAVNIARWFYT